MFLVDALVHDFKTTEDFNYYEGNIRALINRYLS